MKVYTYCRRNGKDEIFSFIDALPNDEKAEAYKIIKNISTQGKDYLELLDTRYLREKVWEIKFRRFNRLFYMTFDMDSLYILHACKKQKNKTELKDIEKAIKRKKELLKHVPI